MSPPEFVLQDEGCHNHVKRFQAVHMALVAFELHNSGLGTAPSPTADLCPVSLQLPAWVTASGQLIQWLLTLI